MFTRDINIDIEVGEVGRLRTPKGGLVLLSFADEERNVHNMEVPVLLNETHWLAVIVPEDAPEETIKEKIIAAAKEFLAVLESLQEPEQQ